MSIPSKPVTLVRFSWKLPVSSPDAADIPAPFKLRQADKQELDDALKVIQSSYNLDPEWSGGGRHLRDQVLPGVHRSFEESPHCLFVQHGNRVIAASAYDPDPADGIHLVSGPCVFLEYRNRGIGAALLRATLEALHTFGLKEASGQTRPNSPAAKFLLTKFGGVAVATPKPQSPMPETAVAA